MILAEEAKKIILENTKEFRVETVHLHAAHGRILANEVRSNDDIPPFRNSSMDGFAIRSQDTISATPRLPTSLTIQDEVAAGNQARFSLVPGNAIRILTGAPLPDNADTVVPIEQVSESEGAIVVTEAVGKNQNTREKGEDVRKGDLVLSRGRYVGAAELGILAALGFSTLHVYAQPSVAILTTGNELLRVDEPLTGGKIRNSNAYSLYALVREHNGQPIDLGVAKDDEADLSQKLFQGLENDVLITSGGISAGKYDYVLNVLKNLGVNLRFWKVNIKPGMPLAFGLYEKDDKSIPVFCLPGNPVSTVVTFLEFVRPCLDKMMSRDRRTSLLHVKATLEHPIQKNDGKRHYHRGVVENKGGKLFVHSTGNQSSGILSSLVKANCLMCLPENQRLFQQGDEIEVELLA